jgi:hypothetical protein
MDWLGAIGGIKEVLILFISFFFDKFLEVYYICSII